MLTCVTVKGPAPWEHRKDKSPGCGRDRASKRPCPLLDAIVPGGLQGAVSGRAQRREGDRQTLQGAGDVGCDPGQGAALLWPWHCPP